MFDSYDILKALKKLNLLVDSPPYWFPNPFSFEIIVGTILTQNTKWENVEKSLLMLKKSELLKQDNDMSLKIFADIDPLVLSSYIVSSGFYNQKGIRLKQICQNILSDFENFDNFYNNVSREWLLSQKGIGMESADCILNYGCNREVMVMDKYTFKFLSNLGVEIPDYEELQSFFHQGIKDNLEKVFQLYPKDTPLSQIYARFHGKIVQFSKQKLILEL